MTDTTQKMTLTSYYDSLPEASAPKTDFVRRLAERTGKLEATVRTWIKDGRVPSDPEDRQIVSELTGVSVDELWPQ